MLTLYILLITEHKGDVSSENYEVQQVLLDMNKKLKIIEYF
jgi:hypothetical protein